MKFLVEVEGPGLFSISHCIYMVLISLVLVAGWIFCGIFIKKEKTQNILIKSLAVILLILILWNRISLALFNDSDEVHKVCFNWKYLLPDTFCGLSSLILALTILFAKKDSIILHGIYIYSLMGGFSNIVLPTYLNTQYWYDMRTISGLAHHGVAFFLIVLLIIFKYFNPRFNRWYVFPLTACIYMTYGLIIYEWAQIDAMQIMDPFIESLPTLTSWYSTFLLQLIVEFTLLTLIEKLRYKKTWKEIFCKDNLWPFSHFETPLVVHNDNNKSNNE